MPYKVKFSNVVKFKCDAILNSVGVIGIEYGKLCRSIIKHANDPGVKQSVDLVINGKVGEIFMTGAGELPCKNIIHIITPRRFEDDDELTLLKKAYSDVIKFAIDKGINSLALPFIGCGANGYDVNEVYDAVIDSCNTLVAEEDKQDKDIINITVIPYYNPKTNEYMYGNDEFENDILDNTYCNMCRNEVLCDNVYPMNKGNLDLVQPNIRHRMEEKACYCKIPVEPSAVDVLREKRKKKNFLTSEDIKGVDINDLRKIKYTDDLYICCDEMSKIHAGEYFYVNLDTYDQMHPLKFALDYCDYLDRYEKDLLPAFSSRQEKNKVKTGGKDSRRACRLTKLMLYRCAVILGMSETMVNQWMSIVGYSFSPLSKTDMFFAKYIRDNFKKWGKAKNLHDLDQNIVMKYNIELDDNSDSFSGDYE